MPGASRLLVAACLVGSAVGFEQLAGFKMPSLQGMKKAIENKEKFGDKKLAVITGTSSGVAPAPLALSLLHPQKRVEIALPLPRSYIDACVRAPPRSQAWDARPQERCCAPANTTSLGACATSTR